MKKVFIIRASGNELANQLWNYASVYAYTIDRGYTLDNPSFFEYGEYFETPATNFIFRFFFFLPFKNYTKRKTAFRRKVWRKFYLWYTNIIIMLHRDDLISCANAENQPYYLPPTKDTTDRLKKLEQGSGNVYLDGWLFRNPTGIEKYRLEVKEFFRPSRKIEEVSSRKIKELREIYETIVGVHIRQGDYKTWRGGQYFIEQKRVREIIEEYLKNSQVSKDKTCFLITSDGPINEEYFSGLNISVSKNNAVIDLFLLASADIVMGSNSTFGAFASYYGNIPFIVMQKNSMDWDYYRDKTKFFQNRYSTMVFY